MKLIYCRNYYIENPSWMISLPIPKDFNGIIKAPEKAYKITNLPSTFDDIQISKKLSKCTEKSCYHIIPDSLQETLELFKCIPGCGLLYTTDTTTQSPFPHGLQYFNFDNLFNLPVGIDKVIRELDHCELKTTDFKGYIGKIFQDGSKFSASVRSKVIIINPTWNALFPNHNIFMQEPICSYKLI